MLRLDAIALAVCAFVIRRVVHAPAAAQRLSSDDVFRCEAWLLKTLLRIDTVPSEASDGCDVLAAFEAHARKCSPDIRDMFVDALTQAIDVVTSTFARFIEIASSSFLRMSKDVGLMGRFVAALESDFALATLPQQLLAFNTARTAWRDAKRGRTVPVASQHSPLQDSARFHAALQNGDPQQSNVSCLNASILPRAPEQVTESTATGTSPVRRARAPEPNDGAAGFQPLQRRSTASTSAQSCVNSAQIAVGKLSFGDVEGAVQAVEGSLIHALQAQYPDLLALAHYMRGMTLAAAKRTKEASEDFGICLHICQQNRALAYPPCGPTPKQLLRLEAATLLAVTDLLCDRCGCVSDTVLWRLSHYLSFGTEVSLSSNKRSKTSALAHERASAASSSTDHNTHATGQPASALSHFVDGALVSARLCIAQIQCLDPSTDELVLQLSVQSLYAAWRRQWLPSLVERPRLSATSADPITVTTAKLQLVLQAALSVAWLERDGPTQGSKALKFAIDTLGTRCVSSDVLLAKMGITLCEAMRLLDLGYATAAHALSTAVRENVVAAAPATSAAATIIILSTRIIAAALLDRGEWERSLLEGAKFLDAQWPERGVAPAVETTQEYSDPLLAPSTSLSRENYNNGRQREVISEGHVIASITTRLLKALVFIKRGSVSDALELAEEAARHAEGLSADLYLEARCIALTCAVKLHLGTDPIIACMRAIDPARLPYRTAVLFVSALCVAASMGHIETIPRIFVADLGPKCATAIVDLMNITTPRSRAMSQMSIPLSSVEAVMRAMRAVDVELVSSTAARCPATLPACVATILAHDWSPDEYREFQTMCDHRRTVLSPD